MVQHRPVSHFGPLQQATAEDWQWQMDVNVNGMINGVQAFLPLMLARGDDGHIVTTASMSAFVSLAGCVLRAVEADELHPALSRVPQAARGHPRVRHGRAGQPRGRSGVRTAYCERRSGRECGVTGGFVRPDELFSQVQH
ncbi:MAG: SDR family NAD(P)-dependent oxidoreductase [Sphingomonadales bacterium]|nr:SDR family NAD(P)-dependent oxidoreductase [Sphingomonadales bacterium]MDE2570602.1 SDR family NAD(P)-dependent oxidoreductase [Sphingomonadales bacterium]